MSVSLERQEVHGDRARGGDADALRPLPAGRRTSVSSSAFEAIAVPLQPPCNGFGVNGASMRYDTLEASATP